MNLFFSFGAVVLALSKGSAFGFIPAHRRCSFSSFGMISTSEADVEEKASEAPHQVRNIYVVNSVGPRQWMLYLRAFSVRYPMLYPAHRLRKDH